jgi:hypothetical protein
MMEGRIEEAIKSSILERIKREIVGRRGGVKEKE